MVAGALGWASSAMADTPTVFGPTYPLPGVSDTAHRSHGGSTCFHSGDVYAGHTLTWVLGPDPANDMPSKDVSTECNDAAAPTIAFDLTRFQTLYWGIDPAHTDFSYCTPTTDSPPDTCTGTPVTSGPMTYDSSASDPANGTLVYQGTSDAQDLLTVHLPSAAVDANTIGTFHDLGSYADQASKAAAIGQVWQVSGTSPPTITMTYSTHGNPLPTGLCNCRTQVDISGGFYYVDLPPSASITSSPDAQPKNHVAETFNVTNPVDPYSADDGNPGLTYAWDLSGGTTYGDGTSSSVQHAYGPGPHTVALLVTDADGISQRETFPFTIVNQKPVVGFTCSPAKPFAKQLTKCTASDHDPDAALGDPPLTEAWTLGTTHHSGHTFSFTKPAGAYNLTLAVTDRDGGRTAVTHKITFQKLRASVAITRGQKLAGALAHGIKGTFRANEAASDQLTLKVKSAKSKTGAPITVAGIVATAKPILTRAGSKAFTLTLSATAKHKLSQAKTVTFLLAGTAKDRFRNTAPTRVSFSLS